jgi:tetratricopeptide (TPR) repeat protein
LRVVEDRDTAEAIAIPSKGIDSSLIKFRFLKKNDAWFLRELIHADTDYHIISEAFQPTIRALMARRSETKAQNLGGSEVARVLIVMQKDAKSALTIVDRLQKEDPNSQGLRHLKAMVLMRNDRKAEAIEIWKQLAAGDKPFAPALLSLAWQHDNTDESQRKMAIDFYTRYAEIEPADPRSHVALARLYEALGNEAQAEAEHRAALRADPFDTSQYVEFAGFLATRKRFKEVDSLITEAETKAGTDDDLFGDLILDLTVSEKDSVSEELARLQSQRMAKSARANLYLGYELIEKGKNIQALKLLKKAASLKERWSEPYTSMARAYRALRNWGEALAATDAAIGMDPEDSDAYFHRACALVKLGRIKEALTALEKSVNLDPYQVDVIKEEADLKVLASRPAFKKILEAGEAQQ